VGGRRRRPDRLSAEWGDNFVTFSGQGIKDSYRQAILDAGVAKHVVRSSPIRQVWRAGQTVIGVDRDQWRYLSGGRALHGAMFDSEDKFTKWLMDQPEPRDLDDQIGPYGGLEIVIDTRLAATAKLGVGRTVVAAGKTWTVTGVVDSGAMGRVFMPRRTAQYFFGERNMERSSVMLVKLKDGVTTIDATAKIKRLAIADHKLGFVEVSR